MAIKVVLGEDKEPLNLQIRSNVGYKIVLAVYQDDVPFDLTGWVGRCELTDLDGNSFSPAQIPVVTLSNSDPDYPGLGVCYVAITREIANFFKGKNGIAYDVCIDKSDASWCLKYGQVEFDTGSSAIP